MAPDAPTAGQSLWNMTGWREVTCEESDQRRTEPRTVLSTLTDPDGVYGPAVVFTEWGDGDGVPIMRDYRHPTTDETCRHYVPEDPRA